MKSERLEASGKIDSSAQSTGDGLTGVIWSTGKHRMSLGGEGTRVFVPKETIKPTFQGLKERVQGGDAPIGFDHVESGSVAGNTSIGQIGVMKEVKLSKDEESIVLTESELTSSNAQQALASGQLDGYDFSFVGSMVPAHDNAGNWIRESDRAVRVAATHIKQVDVVSNGAVRNAQIGNVPTLAAKAKAHERASERAQFYGITPAHEEGGRL
jgi:hypothetical protein